MTRAPWPLAAVVLTVCVRPTQLGQLPHRLTTVDVEVSEGTSMAVAASPDGQTLALDLHGSIWTLPVAGGVAKQITDGFDDARQPAWSPDGRSIAFHSYRDGGYHIWSVAPDGTGRRQLTSGRFDDREPAWSHDGSRIAFSSDRDATGNYDIWTVDVRSGALRRITTAAANDAMPTWSPDDSQIAFTSSRGGGDAVWVIALATGVERRHTPMGVTADAASWGPGGTLVYHASAEGGRLEADGVALTVAESVFPFRPSWISPTEIVYTSDGRIRRRVAAAGARAGPDSPPRTIDFRAILRVNRAEYGARPRDVDARTRRPALGIVSPAISPDGTRIAFAALGDIWVMRAGFEPEHITDDEALDTEPAWSRDGRHLAFASDRGGGFLNLWIRDLAAGSDRQVTRLAATSAMAPAWSPDGRQIAFLEVNGLWRRASVAVVDVATGEVRRLRESIFGPGSPTWSADGKRVLVATVVAYSSRFREGTNQVLSLPVASDAGAAQTFPLIPDGSIDSRVGAGPVWSPDGTRIAAIHDGVLVVVPVDAQGRPAGTHRRITTELAHAPTWTADSRRILYQSMDRLALVDVESARSAPIAVPLTYEPAIPTGLTVVHAGLVVDPSREAPQRDMDIVIERNRIARVESHRDANHAAPARVVDGSGLTAIPGLIEFHSHLQKDMGAAHGRAWLAFGITTVRSPGNTPYEAVEEREAVEAGVRPGPRIFAAGYLMEWQRAYYKMSVAVASDRHLEMELERARRLRHDLLKSYVRMPDLQQRRIVEFAHETGIPAYSHEVYPSAFSGIDGVEHTTGTSRRGYSPKMTASRSYADVPAILGAARMTFTPTLALSATWVNRLLSVEPRLRGDPRFQLFVPWVRPAAGASADPSAAPAPLQFNVGGAGQMILDVSRAGGRIVAGTDTPGPASLHAEIMAYVAAGMSPREALRSATIVPAQALGLDAGAIQAGKLADIVLVEGNPLERITSTARVKWTIANGHVFSVDELTRSR